VKLLSIHLDFAKRLQASSTSWLGSWIYQWVFEDLQSNIQLRSEETEDATPSGIEVVLLISTSATTWFQVSLGL